MTLTQDLKSKARELGFLHAGTCPAVTPGGIHRFYEWLERGYAGSMSYLQNRSAAYQHPEHVLNGVRSLLVLTMPYDGTTEAQTETGGGRVSRYAWGSLDYHDLIHKRLKSLVSWLSDQRPGSSSRGVVDTAPLLEREFAQLAGLGWIGKNTLLINPQVGSWFFLAVVLTDLELEYDLPFETDHCGTCTACLDACPTDAFPQPYVLDARRCISYLTIEQPGVIPQHLRKGIESWAFGCDICQAVCPWNRHAPHNIDKAFEPVASFNPLTLDDLFWMDEKQFRHLFRRTPMWRAKRRGLLRNAAIVMANQRDTNSIPALEKGTKDEEPIVRASCVWALSQMPEAGTTRILEDCRRAERDPLVIEELNRIAEN